MEWFKIRLTEKEMAEIKEAEKAIKNTQLLKRLQCVKLKDKNWKNGDLALFFDVCLGTITNWLKTYKKGGVEELIRWDYKGRVSILTETDQEKIKARHEKKPFGTAKEAKAFIKEEFGIEWHLHWVQKLLKKNFDFHSKQLD